MSKILRTRAVQPHKIRYYVEQRDPEFESKMKQVLHVYRQVEIWHKVGAPTELMAVLSYDEKPGMQAIENTAPDLPPVPRQHAAVGRDHEYVRHGTLSLLAGIDLWNGEVLGLVRTRHSQHKSTVITTNTAFSEWGNILFNTTIATPSPTGWGKTRRSFCWAGRACAKLRRPSRRLRLDPAGLLRRRSVR